MERKLWMATSLLVTGALVLGACAPATTPTAEPPAEEPTAAVEPTEVPAEEPTEAPAEQPTEAPSGEATTITIWHGWAGDYEANIAAMFEQYEADHPGVTIELSRPDNLNEAASVAIPAGEGPDIFAWANDQIGTQAIAGNIVPLNEFGVDEAFLTDNYEPAGVSGVSYDGEIWGLPETQEGIALIYNKALVTDEFLPSGPEDWDGLLAAAEAFKAANPDSSGLICNQGFAGGDAYHIAPVYFGFGVPSYVAEDGTVGINTPAGLDAANWLLSLKGSVAPDQNGDICLAGFVEGQFGMIWTGPWNIANIENAGIDYGFLPMGRPFVGIKTLMLTSNAVDRGNAELAIDIMKYFTSAEVQAQLAVQNGTIPAQTAALSDPEVAGLATISGFGQALNLGTPMANTPLANAQWGPIGDMQAAIWSGSQTPEQALEDAQTTIEAAVAELQ
jgi:arabinogalactan oligomer/maltooligosaccharide transport system substrate-binding protein